MIEWSQVDSRAKSLSLFHQQIPDNMNGTHLVTTIDYRNQRIPATTTFNVTWWIYLVFVSIGTVYCILLIFKAMLYAVLHEKSGCLTVICSTLLLTMIFAIDLCLQWFALMWKDAGCMIAILVLDVILLIIMTAIIPTVEKQSMHEENRVSVGKLIFEWILAVCEIILVSILLSEVKKMN